MHEFGSSGVRGVANRELTPGYVLQLAQAAGAVWDAERAALARDTRTTGQQFANAAAAGLASVGFDVDRLGEVPTPGLQAYCDRESIPGFMVTASHNPPSDNGVKLVGTDGVELDRGTLDRIKARLAEGPVETVAWDDVGQTASVDDAGEAYVESVLAAVDAGVVADADLTVVVDTGHGAGSHTSPTFFRELGCTVHTVNAQPDGRFPGRNPEPVARNLADLREYVRSTDADLGIAHDGDADRATFVDERGRSINGDAALAALVDDAVAPGEVVVSAVNVSQRVVDVVDRAGGDLSKTAIGSTYITTRVRELAADGYDVAIAGEGNGGVIYPEYRVARDGLYTAAKFLELVAERPASEVVADYDGYANVRHSIEYADEAERRAMLDAVEAAAADATADLDTTDGFRLEFGDGWVLARQSGTESVIRVYAEARTEERAHDLADVFVTPVREVREGGTPR